MKKQITYCLVVLLLFSVIISCQKNIDDSVGDSPNTSHTVSNISGRYALKALTWTYLGTTYNVYDSLDACEKDDLYKFNPDLTLNIIDTGIVCSPSGSATDTWTLRNDSIFIGASKDGGKIKSFDGTTLVLSGTPATGPGVTGITTFVKK